MPGWLKELAPILGLLAVIAVVVVRLPKVDLGHSKAFTRRRFLNWFPLGLTYAFLYFGRYNINEVTSALGKLTDKSAFGTIFAVGSAVYAWSFLVNGPLTDKLGGRKTILIAALGAGIANAMMGVMVWAVMARGWAPPGGIVTWFCVLYGLNMYFQSFGAVSIVKVNAAWFHLRERGTFGGIFGILISLGLYFAYDWGSRIVDTFEVQWLFWIPAAVLALFFVLSAIFVRNQPSDAGLPDFDLGDATRSDGPRLGPAAVFWKLLSHPVLLTIAISGGPFLGLLGTVVGVMITFAAVAQSGDVNVNAIAPGIAAALAATVAGLAVAIPALFGYNYLLTKIKSASNDMHVFIDEFVTKLAEFYSGTAS